MGENGVREAVILAAGEGTRLRPLTYTRPKVLIPLLNKPFLGHQLQLLSEVGVRRAVVVIGHKRDVLEDWLSRGMDADVEVETRHQKEPKGTGDAISKAQGAISGTFLVLNGDILLDRPSLSRMTRKGETSVSAKRVDNPQDYGVFRVGDDGLVREVAEKVKNPPSNLANAGSYVFEPDVFDMIKRTPPNPKRGEIEITDTLQGMIDAGRAVRCHEVDEWHELGKPWDLLNLNETFLQRVPPQVETTARVEGRIDDRVSIGEDSVIEETARVIGPTVLGRGCRIEGNAEVGPFCSIGDGSVLSGCRVQGSVLMDGCEVREGANVSCSILGAGCCVGTGASLLDRDAKGGSVHLAIKGIPTDSGRHRLGAVLGDHCSIRRDAVIRAGASLDPGTSIPSGSVVGADR
jgi:bifunctional UDP-N-acetylglucosamine pyrophosphorylase/glucosamine-1-phosphate N-acetyltransferase